MSCKKLGRFLIIFVALFNSILLHPEVAGACSCEFADSVSKKFAEADTVFVGTVASSNIQRPSQSFPYQIVVFEVKNSWKGARTTYLESLYILFSLAFASTYISHNITVSPSYAENALKAMPGTLQQIDERNEVWKSPPFVVVFGAQQHYNEGWALTSNSFFSKFVVVSLLMDWLTRYDERTDP
jgi:hypothetical protein